MKEQLGHSPVIVAEENRFQFEEGQLPAVLESYRHKLPWPFTRSVRRPIYLAAFFDGQDLVMKNRVHDGIDFHVKAGTKVRCVEDGQIIYGIDDERGFADLFIQGDETSIQYRYCHLKPDSLPWDYRTLWGNKAVRPMVKAGQILGRVGPWFRKIPSEIEISQELEDVYGRKRDHLHLETSYNPYPFFSWEHWNTKTEEFNPLLVLQRPEDYFRK